MAPAPKKDPSIRVLVREVERLRRELERTEGLLRAALSDRDGTAGALKDIANARQIDLRALDAERQKTTKMSYELETLKKALAILAKM